MHRTTGSIAGTVWVLWCCRLLVFEGGGYWTTKGTQGIWTTTDTKRRERRERDFVGVVSWREVRDPEVMGQNH
jgi:hypothetical protein